MSQFLGNHVVVIGAGYAGSTFVTQLARLIHKQLKNKEIKITLINPNPYFELSDELSRSLRNSKEYKVPIAAISKKIHVHFIEAQVMRINSDQKIVYYQDWEAAQLNYDYLICAQGSKEIMPQLDGLGKVLSSTNSAFEKNIFLLENYLDVQQLQSQLKKHRWHDAKGFESQKDFFLVIVGANDQGLKLAGELAHIRQNVNRNRLILIDQKKSLARDLSPVARKILISDLKKLTVETVLGSPATAISKRALNIENGQIIPWDLIIFCPDRHAPQNLFENSDIVCGPQGYQVNHSLEIPNLANHYAIGDAAHIPYKKHRMGSTFYVPKKSLFAIQEGQFLAEQMVGRLVAGEKSPVANNRFTPKDRHHFINLGLTRGVGRLGSPRHGTIGQLSSPFLSGPAVYQAQSLLRLNFERKIRYPLLPI